MKSQYLHVLLIFNILFLCRIQDFIAIPISTSLTPSNATIAHRDLELKANLNTSSTSILKTTSTQKLDKKKLRLKVRSDDTVKDETFLSIFHKRQKLGDNSKRFPWKDMRRLEVNPTPSLNYYPPNFPLSTVCMGSTIPYGEYKIMDWIKRERYSFLLQERPFYISLRRQMYENGNSEECHTPAYNKFYPYIQCALIRHQRMEFEVPRYPVHQKDHPMNKNRSATLPMNN
ncbi:uncharacterized protein LOC117568688 [Drosophila albomicans]|uniref:Uncharacterized protein LOC117568688 n=1 Tax=Drosophila albomicans TaxID=7291 RepID=A0A6P8WT47_DROAB|nr:uncharacterized protein LOC117568688 [Drosophila albomicans]